MKHIWVNGCFDVLHKGHIELFKHAASLGDRLIVGIDTDERVRAAKGPSRPINSVEDRKAVLESIKYIDHVVTFSTDKELEYWVDFWKPRYMVVGSDWQGKTVVGERYAQAVKYYKRIGDYSTTKILEKK
tara:strand:+ start:126 stop:515 length:390 start_codon:yes stop_codon:yes gene_type:complete